MLQNESFVERNFRLLLLLLGVPNRLPTSSSTVVKIVLPTREAGGALGEGNNVQKLA